jgi:hypothetical protein
MFGMNDDNQQSNDDPAMLDNVKQLASEPANAVEPAQQFQATPADPINPVPAPNFSATHTAVAEPAQGFSSSPLPEPAAATEPVATDSPIVSSPSATTSYSDSPFSSTPSTPSSDDSGSQSTIPAADPDHLAGMKQEALQHLEPLVEHLDGTPEETFKTTMMMIQANDNHNLLEKALEAAKKIEDDKVRAQAMLDIVNEINYFSQNG